MATSTPAADRVANIFQFNRETVRIQPKPRYDVTVMVGGEVEAYISAADGSETVIAKLVPAKAGEQISVIRYDDGSVDVRYETGKVLPPGFHDDPPVGH